MKTTKTDFRLFKRECGKWLARLGLLDCRIDFVHKDLGNEETMATMFPCDPTQKQYTIVLNKKNFCPTFSENEIKRTAFHEIAHVFLFDIETNGKLRWGSDFAFDMAIHAAINRLECAFFDQGL